MKISHLTYEIEECEQILEEPCDCLWISFHGRKAVSPLASRALQCVDWKMSGLLSRYILDQRFLALQTTFVPTLKKIPAAFLALAPQGKTDWDLFARNCEGQQWKRVMCFVENPEVARQFEKELSAILSKPFPEEVVLACDG